MTHPPGLAFSTVRWIEGYDIAEVNAFILEVEPQVLERAPDRELAQRITRSRFTPVRIRPGYNMDEVDAYLDRLLDLALYGQRSTQTGFGTPPEVC